MGNLLEESKFECSNNLVISSCQTFDAGAFEKTLSGKAGGGCLSDLNFFSAFSVLDWFRLVQHCLCMLLYLLLLEIFETLEVVHSYSAFSGS